jgi:hypothetical protein
VAVAAVAAAAVVSADSPAQPQAGAPCDAAEPDSQTFAKPRTGQQTFKDGRPTETKTNNVGQYCGFTVYPQMASLSLKGNCHWLISPCSGKKGPCTASYVPQALTTESVTALKTRPPTTVKDARAQPLRA